MSLCSWQTVFRIVSMKRAVSFARHPSPCRCNDRAPLQRQAIARRNHLSCLNLDRCIAARPTLQRSAPLSRIYPAFARLEHFYCGNLNFL